MLTRRDFEVIASCVKSGTETACSGPLADDARFTAGAEHARAAIAAQLAIYCYAKNRAFDRARFLEACGAVEVPDHVKA